MDTGDSGEGEQSEEAEDSIVGWFVCSGAGRRAGPFPRQIGLQGDSRACAGEQCPNTLSGEDCAGGAAYRLFRGRGQVPF